LIFEIIQVSYDLSLRHWSFLCGVIVCISIHLRS
jgi:hypothetical protein